MTTFRNRPHTITATQWFPMQNVSNVIEQQDDYGYYGLLDIPEGDEDIGPIVVNPGDWVVIRDGEVSVYKAEVFEEMYERVEE